MRAREHQALRTMSSEAVNSSAICWSPSPKRLLLAEPRAAAAALGCDAAMLAAARARDHRPFMPGRHWRKTWRRAALGSWKGVALLQRRHQYSALPRLPLPNMKPRLVSKSEGARSGHCSAGCTSESEEESAMAFLAAVMTIPACTWRHGYHWHLIAVHAAHDPHLSSQHGTNASNNANMPDSTTCALTS
jgi:hypothetical protein